ncbi:MAG: hypothetical protein JXB03_08030 [Spirochaetales bacterium]|nr:hypothetical protein [Spirochaetales bacterium]
MKQRIKLVVRIFLANLVIPLSAGVFREMLVGIFNPYIQKTFTERILFSLRPGNYIAIVVFSFLSSTVIIRFLKPLFTFLDSGVMNTGARRAALRVPWFLTAVHFVSWALGVTVFYAFVFHWKAPGGYSYLISLVNIIGAGFITGILTALYINNLLLPVKLRLNMTSIEKGEKDLFLKYKNYLIVIATVYNIGCFLFLVMNFYVHAAVIPAGYFSPGVQTVLVAGFWGFMCMLLMVFSRREDAFQCGMIKQKLKQLNEAGGDLTENIPLVNFDDIGSICHLANRFISLLRGRLTDVLSTSGVLVGTGSSLAESIRQAGNAVEATFSRINSALSTMETQSAVVEASTRNVGSIFNSVTRFDAEYRRQGALVGESSGHIRGLVQVFGGVESTISAIQGSFDRLKEAADMSSGEITGMAGEINTLQGYTSSLKEANKLISTVAARTNLLAMNAAIEAAHAGDSGRGFAVVAGEIRTLAEHTAAQSSDISSLLKMTFAAVEKVTAGMASVMNTMQSFQSIVQGLQEEERELQQVMGESRKLSTDTLSGIESLEQLTVQVQKEFGSILSDTRTIEEQMAELESSSRSLEAQIKEIDNFGKTVKERLDDMARLGDSNGENIQAIEASVGTFRI